LEKHNKSKFYDSITIQILKITFAIYLFVTVSVTLIHMRAEYLHIKEEVFKELRAMQETFKPVLTQALWRLDKRQWESTINGMMKSPILVAVKLQDKDEILYLSGIILDDNGKIVSKKNYGDSSMNNQLISYRQLYKHEFILSYAGEYCGKVTLYSSNFVVYQRVKVGFLFIVLNAIIKSIALWFLFVWIGNRLLNRPLKKITDTLQAFNFDKIEDIKIDIKTSRPNELKILEESFNLMIKKLIISVNELKDSEYRFRSLFEQAAVGVAMVDNKTGQFLKINQRYCSIVGYEQKEMSNKTFKEMTYSDDLQEDLIYLNKIIAGDIQKYSMDKRYYHKDGNLVWVKITVSLMGDENSHYSNHIRIVEDITELKNAENELKNQKKLLQTIIDNIPVFITLYDPAANVMLVNKEFEMVIGWTNQEIKNVDLMKECYPDPEYRAKALEYMMKASTEWAEFTIKTKGGKNIETIWSNALLENGTQIGIGIDITEKKKIEAQLQQTMKMEAIATLAGGIAHDFNNMLGVIIGNISYSLSIVDKDEELYEVLYDVKEGAQKAQYLTHQLLTFSKGGTPLRKISDLNNIIEESAKFVLRGAKSKCKFDLAKDLWPVEVDPGQMNQVISNLVINANQAMPNGGFISIKTTNIEHKAEDNIILPEGKYIKITIEDQGIGISKKHLDKIFDPFFTTKQTGSGLGLSTTFSIIKKHGGIIKAYSEIDKGSVFNIFLPASLKSVQKIKENNEIKHKGHGRILIMDDQESILMMIQRMLFKMGYETLFATNGAQAVELYSKEYQSGNKIDLVILDLTIPGGMGGTETITELLKIDSNVKAVVSSGYSENSIMSNYKDYGFCGVVPKPYTKDQIAELLNNIFDKP